MGKETKADLTTEKVEAATDKPQNATENPSPVNDDADFRAVLEPQITALSDKIFEVRPDAAIGGDKGAIGVAIDLLSELHGVVIAQTDALENAKNGGGLDILIGEAQKQLTDISIAMQPLAQYLKTEGLLEVGEGEQITVSQICAAAVHGLQVHKANVTEMEVKVNELTPDPSQLPKRKFKAISMPDKVEEDAFNTASIILFANESGNVISDLPPLSFATDQFLANHVGRTLNAPIDFPVHVPANAVANVYLVDPKGKPVGVSEMVMPLNVGGGKSARINAGSLLFRAPEKEVTEEASKAA